MIRKTSRWVGVILLVFALVLIPALAGDVIVKFSNDIQRIQPVPNTEIISPDFARIRSDTKSTEELISEMRSRGDVVYAEPNYLVYTQVIPNDPYYNPLYGMQKISAPQAWDISTSAGTVVTVIDTGIDYNHPDLTTNIWSAPREFTVNVGGVILTCPQGSHGYNAILNTCNPQDDHYHGTHCSGTIGAIGNNALGVPGVNWNAQIMGAKFLSSGGSGYTSDAIKSLEFIIQVKQQGLADVRVTSNSWGGGSYSQALYDEIIKAGDNGILFVAAAGNSARDADITPMYPAAYNVSTIISVAATDSNDNLASFSNWGLTSVDLGAPGVSIYSTLLNGTYGYLSGTSMATPHMAGAAALILSKCPLTTLELKANLMDNTDPIAALAGKTVSGGRLNVAKAISSCSGAPPTPTPTVTPTPTPTLPTPTPTPTPIPTPTPAPGPTAAFHGYPLRGLSPLTVQFTDESLGNPVHYLWIFGDGTSSIERNPFHIYNSPYFNPAAYTVSLMVEDKDWKSNITMKSGYIIVDPSPAPGNPPKAEFMGEPRTGPSTLIVNFTDLSTGEPTAWFWAFGDGQTSTERNPIHTYVSKYYNPAAYTVSLNVTNQYGMDEMVKPGYIVLDALPLPTPTPTPTPIPTPNLPPITGFTALTTSGRVPLIVNFYDRTLNKPTSWVWQFGDGQISTEQNPIHTYREVGKYTVILTTNNGYGCDSYYKVNYIKTRI